MPTRRIEWIDTLRAFAIFAIVLGHTLRGASIYCFLYSFHVPLCIMISGFCFSYNKTFKQLAVMAFKKMYIPYLIFGMASIIIYVILAPIAEGHSVISQIPEYALGLIYGNGYLGMESGGFMRWNLPLWYIPCLIADEIVSWAVDRFLGKTLQLKQYAFVRTEILITVIAALIISRIDINLPFGFETAVALCPFFFIGKAMKMLWKQHRTSVHGGGDTRAWHNHGGTWNIHSIKN